MPRKLIQVETRAGTPMQIGGTSILPFARTIRLEFPGAWGGIIWNRPGSLLVNRPDGSEQIINLPDVTRQAQIAMLAFGLFGGILLSLLMRMFIKR